jgi:hypothetical protein
MSIDEEIARLKREPEWTSGRKDGITLVKYPRMRILHLNNSLPLLFPREGGLEDEFTGTFSETEFGTLQAILYVIISD